MENQKKMSLFDLVFMSIGGIIGDVVSVKDNSIVIETSADRVRVEFAKFAVSSNNTAEKEAAKQKAAMQSTESESSMETEIESVYESASE